MKIKSLLEYDAGSRSIKDMHQGRRRVYVGWVAG